MGDRPCWSTFQCCQTADYSQNQWPSQRARKPSWSEMWEPAIVPHLQRVALNDQLPDLWRAYATSTYLVCVASLRLINGLRSAPPHMDNAAVFHGVAALSKGADADLKWHLARGASPAFRQIPCAQIQRLRWDCSTYSMRSTSCQCTRAHYSPALSTRVTRKSTLAAHGGRMETPEPKIQCSSPQWHSSSLSHHSISS